MSVPEEKLQKNRSLCTQWLEKSQATKRELQSLLGLLLYISKCIKAARVFLSRMLDTQRKHHNSSIITLDEEFKKDMRWFYKFVHIFNGVSFFDKRPVKATIELDASLNSLGAAWGELVYTVPLVMSEENFSIVHWEMLNILVAIRVWGHQWESQKILFKCDNQAVVSVLNSGKSSDMTLSAIARNILFSVQNSI